MIIKKYYYRLHWVATIKEVHNLLPIENSLDDMAINISKLATLFGMQEKYIGGGHFLNAFCRTLFADRFRESVDPPYAFSPLGPHSIDLLAKYLRGATPSSSESKYLSAYLDFISLTLLGRCFYTTNEGYIGIGTDTYTREMRSFFLSAAILP
jgi:hypothetical protein